MEDNSKEVETAVSALSIVVEAELLQKYNLADKEDENKNLRKKIRKQQIEPLDGQEKAQEKVNKLLDDLYKGYEAAGKQLSKMKAIKTLTDSSEGEREKMAKQKTMFENLFNGFKKRYDEELKKAQNIEKEEEDKRKAVIEELQERIKNVQARYEQAGKIKIEKFRENETLKHELSKYEPHLVASQSLADAQLKKKSIEIEIQMTTLKQKIEMMDNFKNMRIETEGKLTTAREVDGKLTGKLAVINAKEEEHKLSLARAHLVFEDYKKAFNVLKETLPKKEREALLAKEKAKKSSAALEELRRKVNELEKEGETQLGQLEVLRNLESQLFKQLEE